MNMLNRVLFGFAAAFAIASSAHATPVTFTLSSIALIGGSGYGPNKTATNKPDPNDNLLDVTFGVYDLPASFNLNQGASIGPFKFGFAHLYDTCIDGPNSGCGTTTNETANLGVTATFNFSSPYFANPTTGAIGYMPVTATGIAYVGPVRDGSPDKTADLDIKFDPVTVSFGNGGQFNIELSELQFVSNSTVDTYATITLLKAPAAPAAVPEPASLGLVGLGLLVAGGALRRKAVKKDS